MSDKKKFDCYECKFRGGVAGSCHSSCKHPALEGADSEPLDELLAMFASVGRHTPVISEASEKLNIRANAHGVRSGWFNWPWNFDPVWLENCDGFEAKETEKTEVDSDG